MRKGYHEFPFDFHLPEDVREAVPPLINSSHDYAHLIYRLKATLDKVYTAYIHVNIQGAPVRSFGIFIHETRGYYS